MKYRIVKRCDLDHIVDQYLKVREISGRKKWNVKFGGYRW